jgi:hypothetical protein
VLKTEEEETKEEDRTGTVDGVANPSGKIKAEPRIVRSNQQAVVSFSSKPGIENCVFQNICCSRVSELPRDGRSELLWLGGVPQPL